MSNVELIEADCIRALNEGPGNEFDVVVTSPPYNIGTDYDDYRDDRDPETYMSWIWELCRAVHWAMSDDASFFLNVGGKPSDPTFPLRVLAQTEDLFCTQNVIHWIKSLAIPEQGFAAGHYKPVQSKRYLHSCQEYIFHLTKTSKVELDRLALGVPYQDPSNAKRWKGGEGGVRCRGNVWFIPYDTVQKSRSHPAAFPIGLPTNCIKLHGLERCHRVLDPCMGEGTTGVACQRLGIDFVGYDVSAKYCAVARKTMEGDAGAS